MSTLKADCKICDQRVRVEDSLTHLLDCVARHSNSERVSRRFSKYYCFTYFFGFTDKCFDRHRVKFEPLDRDVKAYVKDSYGYVYHHRLQEGYRWPGLNLDDFTRLALSQIDDFDERYLNAVPGITLDEIKALAPVMEPNILFSIGQQLKLQ